MIAPARSRMAVAALQRKSQTLVMRGALFRHLSTTDTSRARGLLRKRMNRSGLQYIQSAQAMHYRCATDAR